MFARQLLETYEFSHILDELVGIYNSTAVKKLTINYHEWAMILLISRVRITGEINKIIAHEWKLRVNFEPAVELLYNSEIELSY